MRVRGGGEGEKATSVLPKWAGGSERTGSGKDERAYKRDEEIAGGAGPGS